PISACLAQNTNETFAGLIGVWGFGMGLLVLSNLCRVVVSSLVTMLRIAGRLRPIALQTIKQGSSRVSLALREPFGDT
ncbi:hypothetical protein, partial [Ferrimicrobium sp.]|uniref:hypothetical protein n=1 Tax=Ferrimicrobium sp. TaxID=2926050 RepID=UPI00260CD50E